MSGKFRLTADAGVTKFSRKFVSFRKAAKEASAYARLYGESMVVDEKAGPGRGVLLTCRHVRRQRRSGLYKSIADCKLSTEGKKLLKKKHRRKS